MPNYIVIGGGAYQAGSAAAKRAQELYNQWKASQPVTAPTVPFPSTPTGGAPTSSAAPSSFPSYAPVGGTASSSGGLMSPTLSGGAPTSGKGAYGLVPSTPNPLATAGGAIAGNQSNLPALSTLGTGTTKLTAGLAQLPYQLNLPNYMENLGQASANVASNLAGVISPSTSNAITRAAAERGVGIGAAPGSPNAQTNWLGVLGQTSEQLQALGANQLNQMIASTPTGQPFNVAGMQTTPGDLQYWADVGSVRGAAPDPTMKAQADLDSLLKAIEAGKVAGFPGFGGGGGGIPRLTAPGIQLSPVSPTYYYGGGAGGYGGTSGRPGTSTVTTYPGENFEEEFFYGQNPGALGGPPIDYSTDVGGIPYPVDMTGSEYFGGSDYINYPFFPSY